MKRSVILLLITAVFAAGCSRHDSSAARPDPAASLPPAKVTVATVRSQALSQFTEVTGLVRPAQRAQLAAKVMGTIDEMPVMLGQRVHTGDLLVKISAGEISARVVQAQSQLNAAKRDLDRERDLLTKGASTADMVHGLEDRFAAAQAMVHEAETMLAYTLVRAPFDGVIARKMANAGDLASPGFALLELEGTADFLVEAGIPESLATSLQPGTALQVEVPVAGLTFAGKVAEISSSADASALTVLAKIAVPADAKVRSGQFARVQVPGAPTPMMLVPSSAVSQLGQMQRVFVAADDNRAVLRLVRTGTTRGDATEITSGLDNNDRVVVAPPAHLREGQRLEIAQ